MKYPLFERPEGFYHSLAFMPDWDDRLVRILDIEDLFVAELDEAEMIILHFNMMGFSIREIAWYYGYNYANLRHRIQTLFDRLAARPLPDGN